MYSLVFCVIAMTTMLYYSANKMIVIADAGQGGEAVFDDMQQLSADFDAEESSISLTIIEDAADKDYLCIPLPAGFKAEQVKIENYYIEKKLRIFLRDVPGKFYENNGISGDVSAVKEASFDATKDGVWLQFELTDIYEGTSILENDCLYVDFVNPRELYEKIVVIDAGHGGEDGGVNTKSMSEKEITLDIARKLKDKFDTTDIKVFYTRTDDANPADEDRIYLANAVDADMFISLHVGYDEEKPEEYGIKAFYNPSFFIPGFGSVELADLIEREIVTGISGQGLGLFEADGECYILHNASMPAIIVQVGYLSNKRESALLYKDEYRQCIADSIYDGVMKAFEEYLLK